MQRTTNSIEEQISSLVRQLRLNEGRTRSASVTDDQERPQAERERLLDELEAALIAEGTACLYCTSSDTNHTSNCTREEPSAHQELRAGMRDGIVHKREKNNPPPAYSRGFQLTLNLDYKGD